MNGYELSRTWFNFSFDNPEKIKPIHTAIYFFAIEHCNRLGWKEKFGFPSQMVMEAIGVKNWRTYSKALNEVVEFGFIKMLEVSKNQYSSNIIAIVKNTKAPTKALDKALQKHSTKQGQSTVSIDKQETTNNLTSNKRFSPPLLVDVSDYFFDKHIKDYQGEALNFFNYYESNGWKVGKNKMKSWTAAANGWISRMDNFKTKQNGKPNPNETAAERVARIYKARVERQSNNL